VEVGTAVERAVLPLHGPAPTGLLKGTLARWHAFWRSPLAKVVNWERDQEAVTRLFLLYDEETRLLKGCRRRRWVPGSTGQPILNPMHNQLRALQREILQLEDRFGRNPKAAAALGISLGGLKKTMDDLNREANDDGDETDEGDPRLQLAR